MRGASPVVDVDKGPRAERLLSLILLLADGRTRSAPALARRFGTSVRTLYRDMDLLSARGIPLETVPGREGGYRVMRGFSLDRSVLSEGEMAAVAAVLQGLSDSLGSAIPDSARAKVRALLGGTADRRRSWIRVELAPGRRNAALLEVLRNAIEGAQVVSFDYVDAEGRPTARRVEPAAVVYLWQSWYLYAFCRLRGDWRLFKLARIRKARGLMERFTPRPEPSETAWRDQWETAEPTPLVLRVDPSARARAEEWFGPESCRPDGAGGVEVRVGLPVNEWLFGFLLSFGPGFRVLEPEAVAREIASRARRIADRYADPLPRKR